MMRMFHSGLFKKSGGTKDRIKGVSEAVGTVLLLGISVTLAGGVVLWTANIDEGEEGIYVDLWATVHGTDLVILHRGGDRLEGGTTNILITDTSGSQVMMDSYSDLTGTTGVDWVTGEELVIDISGPSVPDTFEVIVTAMYDSGISTVILKNELVKTGSLGGLPDLAVTRVHMEDEEGTITTTILDNGAYDIVVRVMNFGPDMTTVHMTDAGSGEVENLKLFDSNEPIDMDSVQIEHFASDDTPILLSSIDFGILGNGEYMVFTFTWDEPSTDPRALGIHTLNVKVIPVFSGEQNYRNNYIEKRFKVDKELTPIDIHGPDPGIYDIYFSNEAPNSGEEVTVTVIMQNSGDEPITSDMGVNMIVSTWEPEKVHDEYNKPEIHDWRMDYDGYYGEWRSDHSEEVQLTTDDTFPTCVRTGLELLPGAYLFFYFTLEARVDVPGGEQWVYAAVDVFNNNNQPQAIGYYPGGDDPGDNMRLGKIQVLPRILLVDDDQAATGSDGDMTSTVLESLVGAGVTVDKMFVAQQISDEGNTRDAPAFSYNQEEIAAPVMEDYDIVMWVTGFMDDPLTNVPNHPTTGIGGNIQELMKYMDSNRYLMIVGTDPFDGLISLFDSGITTNPLVINDVSDNASRFLYNYMGIYQVLSDRDIPVEDPTLLYGMDNGEGNITETETGAYTIELMDQTIGNEDMGMFVPRSSFEAEKFEIPIGVLTTADESVRDTPLYNSIRSFSTPDEQHFNASYRAIVLAWNLTQIKHLNEKVDIFSNILNWFDWEVEVGRDLAVTRMNLYIIAEEESGWVNDPVDDDNTPKYLDTVLIEAYVRNNGPNLESSSVMFYVTGPDGVELPITPNIPDPRNNLEPEDYDNPYDMNGLSGGGSEVEIYKLWLAVGVGTYTFRVVVDPFHLITEISEENNDISYSTSTITSFVTKNNILVVDDDMTTDNFPDDMDPTIMDERRLSYIGLGGEPSIVVENTLASLDYDFDDHIVINDNVAGDWDYDSSLSILDLKRYNSVVWITGDSGDRDAFARETFTDEDMEAIKRYLDGDYPEAKYLPEGHHENLMVIGSNFMHDLTLSNDEIVMASGSYFVHDIIEEYFGVDAVAPSSEPGVSLIGPTVGSMTEQVYLGIDYEETELSSHFLTSSLVQLPPMDIHAEPMEGLWAQNLTGADMLISTQYGYDNTGSSVAVERNFRVVLHSWQLTSAATLYMESPLREILYLPLHWFDTPEDDPELVGRSCRISMETENPVIGNSYVIQAEVANIGGVSGGGTVRFMDGDTLVQSENVYLNSDTSTTIEAIWSPLYAGERTITVWIDRYNDYEEVFDIINNAPTMTLDVFFFWDDMESGDGNWDHDSTILRINGEGTLDYMGEPTYTNIEKDWLVLNGFHKNTDVENTVVQREFYSSPSSYYMYEPNLAGTSRKDIDLVMMLDTSGSMNDDGWDPSISDYQPIGDMKIAAMNVIDQLTENDRVAIFTFDGSGNPSVRLTFTYMTQVNRDTAKNLIDGFSANGYTPLWDSIGQVVNYAVSNQRTTNVYTAAMALTDGDDYGRFGREDGSTVYCPGSEPATSFKTHTWGTNLGLKWGDTDYDFVNQDGISYHDVVRFGGDGASSSGSWLNLWDETRTGLIHAPIPVHTIGLGIGPHENDPLAPLMGADYQFTSEYDLWQIAETSDGNYYYASNSSVLDKIFQDIFQQVEQEAQASTRGGPTRGVGPWTDGNEVATSKYMHTSVVDLKYADEAELSFKHKYNMKVGSNGGIILIGTDTDGDGTWDFKYVQPDQPYTGNFLTSAWPFLNDSYGNKMRWCWNGLSGGGSLDWDHVTVDLKDFLGEEVIVAFIYYYLSGGTGYGWIIDDVDIMMSTDDTNPDKDLSADSWTLQNVTEVGSSPGVGSYSGYNAWFIGDPNKGGDLKPGVDNSLYTRQIDLTNARTATLEAMLRFNIDTDPGRPPDGFRVEVSTDNKETWVPLNLGVRSAWGISGTEADADDGIPDDDKSYTGLDLEGNGNNWVPANTLTRLRTDLAAFTGNVINIRFRVTTNTDLTHYSDPNQDMGLYIDDVFVYGSSLTSTRGDSMRSVEIEQVRDDPLPEKFSDMDIAPVEDDVVNAGYSPEMSSPVAPEEAETEVMVIEKSEGDTSYFVIITIFLAIVPAVFINVRRRRRGF